MGNVKDRSKPKSKKMKLNDINKGAGGKVPSLKEKRICLKCGGKFPSKGPYNRICDKCSSMNERVSSSMYAIRNSPPSDLSPLEKRFYGQN